MKYIKTIWHNLNANNEYIKTHVMYYEMDDNNYCIRYVFFVDNKISGGDTNQGYNSDFPPEGKVFTDIIELNQDDEYIYTSFIDKKEFENVWSLMFKQNNFKLLPYPNIKPIQENYFGGY